MRKPTISKIIEDKHNNAIIMLLYLCGRKSKTEIYTAVSSNPRMSIKLDNLVAEGIITMTKEKNPRERSMVDLTPLGVKYAEGLCRLETSVGGDVEALRRDGSSDPGYEEIPPGPGSVVSPVVGDVVGLAFEPLEGPGKNKPDIGFDVQDLLHPGTQGLGHPVEFNHVLRQTGLVEFDLDNHPVHVVLVGEGDVVERGQEGHLADDALDLGREHVDPSDY